MRSLLTQPLIPISPEDCIFVDYEGLNDRITSTNQTSGRENLRATVVRRDGSCVVTEPAAICDAAHLIPRNKSDEVMFTIILCDLLVMVCASTLPRLSDFVLAFILHHTSVSGINDGQNGMLLSATLHRRLGRGEVAFIKVRNFRSLFSTLQMQPFLDAELWTGTQ